MAVGQVGVGAVEASRGWLDVAPEAVAAGSCCWIGFSASEW